MISQFAISSWGGARKDKVGRHDIEIGLIIRAIEKMIKPEPKPKRRIGFHP